MDLFIADRFTVADACLVPALNWATPAAWT